MLKTEQLIKNVEEKYIDMLKKVNIPDFTKCLSEFSGMEISAIDDRQVKAYLVTWAKNKYRFYLMLGEQLFLDKKVEFDSKRINIGDEIHDLEKEFPAYAFWLEGFEELSSNKIGTKDLLSYRVREKIEELFPDLKITGASMTHFFKKYLKASNELVTSLGRIFENDKIAGNYTISIDPVDMMLASETPYGWDSCYRLETENDCSHADGCLAAVLDSTSLITYIWNREGKYNLEDNFYFKNIRYKKMREWISINDKFDHIYFNKIYPQKDCKEELMKELRNEAETLVCNYIGKENLWQRAEESHIERKYLYGYNEFDTGMFYKLKDAEPCNMYAYDEPILCVCGCLEELLGSDEGNEYYGNGFHHGCYSDNYYCDIVGDWCDEGNCTEEQCAHCRWWKEEHPLCKCEE